MVEAYDRAIAALPHEEFFMKVRTLLLFVGVLCAVVAGAEPFSGKVTEVLAPDLLKVERDGAPYEVRLYGADAPEAGQPFSAEALAFAKEKALGQVVTVEGVATDTLGKVVGSVKLADGSDLATLLIAGGFAWWDEKNAPEAKALQAANAKALLAKGGLFKEGAPLAPWDFRKSHGADAYAYTLKPVEKKEEEKKPVELKLKGDMKESASTALALPPGINVPKDAMAMIDRHKPRIAMDASGKPMGITADDIASVPEVAALGFQNGDIATAVNGIPIRSELDAYGAAMQLMGKKDFTISVDRGGSKVDIPVHID